MKDDYYYILFPNINYNPFITLMPKYICKVLLEGSLDASALYDENISILNDVFLVYRLNKGFKLILSKN